MAHTEFIVNAHRLHRVWLGSILLGVCSLFLSGCQVLSGGGSSGGSSLAVTNASLNFGTVADGSSKTLQDTLTNNRASSVMISSITGSSSELQVLGITTPAVLVAGQSVPFSVKFQPSASGSLSRTISLLGADSNVLVSLTVSGQAASPGQLSLNPSSVAFGSVKVGSSQTTSVILSNTGGSDLTINQATLSGAGFSTSNLVLPLTLHAGGTASFSVTFVPTGGGTFTGHVTFAMSSSSNVLLPLSGTGVTPGQLAANPPNLSFGTVQVGNRSSKSETLTNTGGSAATISQANVTGASFSVSGLTLPTTLSSNQSVTFTVICAPSAAGAASGTLSIVSNASNSPLNVALSGTGTTPGQLAVFPATLSFGNVVVGSSSSLSGTLNATGAAVTVSSASNTNNEFALSGISLPTTIAAGASASFTVTFTPQSSGSTSGKLSFVSNATNTPAVQSLTGTGTTPPPHSVDLTWNSSANAVGYNVYRGTVSGGPYSIINTSLVASTTYTDNNVTAGQTYYYVVTAVDGNSKESGYSNQVVAVIPTP